LWLWLDGNGLFGSNSHCPASVYFAVIAVASGAQRMKGYWLRPEKLRHGVGIRMTSFDPPRPLSTISVSGTVVEASLGLVSGGAASPWPHCFRWWGTAAPLTGFAGWSSSRRRSRCRSWSRSRGRRRGTTAAGRRRGRRTTALGSRI